MVEMTQVVISVLVAEPLFSNNILWNRPNSEKNNNYRLVTGPNLGPASTNRDLRLYPEVCFSCIVTNLHLSVI